jgi:hypothetical protein
MKKFALLLSVLASVVLLNGCCNSCAKPEQPCAQPAPAHHDFKGEVGK